MARIERATSPLPRECSTTELHGRSVALRCPQLPISSRVFPRQYRAMQSVFEIAGAGEGNRTLVVSLEGFCSTIELHPRAQLPFVVSAGAGKQVTKSSRNVRRCIPDPLLPV